MSRSGRRRHYRALRPPRSRHCRDTPVPARELRLRASGNAVPRQPNPSDCMSDFSCGERRELMASHQRDNRTHMLYAYLADRQRIRSLSEVRGMIEMPSFCRRTGEGCRLVVGVLVDVSSTTQLLRKARALV